LFPLRVYLNLSYQTFYDMNSESNYRNNSELFAVLEEKYKNTRVSRPFNYRKYLPGKILSYDLQSVSSPKTVKISLQVEKYIGGGFAGQVYRVRLIEVSDPDEIGLIPGKLFALKIFKPASNFSCLFRELIYRIGFQSPFMLQINRTAVLSGSLWHKFIRRAAKITFGSEKTVVDVYGILKDENLGSYGELLEWIEGRTWLLEVDDHINHLSKSLRNPEKYTSYSGSVEFRNKYKFMHYFCRMLHDMGAFEFARQYEWTTLKSQPNCLKRTENHEVGSNYLTAVDFRAGLALLPLLPMSPGDFKLICRGLFRGSPVQFDRGNITKLKRFVEKYEKEYKDMQFLLQELENNDTSYRRAQIDITHYLFIGIKRWGEILRANIKGWQLKKICDDKSCDFLFRKPFLALPFFILSFIPLFGNLILKLFLNKPFLNHYLKQLISFGYLKRTFKANRFEKLYHWLQSGRIGPEKAHKLEHNLLRFTGHLLCSILPINLHKFFTNNEYFKYKLYFIFVRPLRLYFNADLRRDWLQEMLTDGKKKNMLSDEDAEIIESQLDEPFIQKYLKSLAVHICTLPVTQVISVFIAVLYVLSHPELPRTQAWGIGLGIIALFQVIPISPGSLVRGLYVLYLVIKEKDFKNYNIAVFLSFFKYVGYLAFPIQMTYHYPALARFMAGHWATEAVHIVPVFGEKGALLEHWVFCLFYNWPLTIRRQIMDREKIRATIKPRYWHYPILILIFSTLYAAGEYFWLNRYANLPEIRDIWWFMILISGTIGMLSTIGAAGIKIWKRISGASIAGLITGLISSLSRLLFGFQDQIYARTVWYIFIFTLFSTLSVVITELFWGETTGVKHEQN